MAKICCILFAWSRNPFVGQAFEPDSSRIVRLESLTYALDLGAEITYGFTTEYPLPAAQSERSVYCVWRAGACLLAPNRDHPCPWSAPSANAASPKGSHVLSATCACCFTLRWLELASALAPKKRRHAGSRRRGAAWPLGSCWLKASAMPCSKRSRQDFLPAAKAA